MNRNDFEICAPAKVNVYLDVTGKRADGYHELLSVMQSIRLKDTLSFKRVEKPGYFKLVCDGRHLPTDERNLIYKAFLSLRDDYGIEGVFIGLQKLIPVSAGLGGGSSDCAAALKGLCRMFQLNLSGTELLSRATVLGADVPFFLHGRTMLAEGIGEKLSPLPAMPYCYVLLARPPVSVSTAAVFGKFRLEDKPLPPDPALMFAALKEHDIHAVSANMYNALECVTEAEHPIISSLKQTMTDNGALGALMSGSGPTVFGIFDRKDRAAAAFAKIKAAHPEVRELFLTTMGS